MYVGNNVYVCMYVCNAGSCVYVCVCVCVLCVSILEKLSVRNDAVHKRSCACYARVRMACVRNFVNNDEAK